MRSPKIRLLLPLSMDRNRVQLRQSTLARKNFKQNLPFPSMWFGGPDRYDAHKSRAR